MIKVMVVLYGMVMFVPVDEMDGKARQLTVLFVDGGSHVPDAEHEPVVRAVAEDGELGPEWPLPEEFEIVVREEAHADPKIDLRVRDDFAPLRKLFTYEERGYVWDDCLMNAGSCRRSGDDLVRGTATFEGEWSTRPATYCGGWKLPVDDYDEAELEFRRSVSGDAHDAMEPKPLATALVLETEVRSLDDLAVTLDGFPMPLEALRDAPCQRWIPEHPSREECLILVMGSPPKEPLEDCTGQACYFDSHFSAFYRVTLDPPTQWNRWMPFVVTTDRCPQPDVLEEAPYVSWRGDRNPPAVRCPPPFGETP